MGAAPLLRWAGLAALTILLVAAPVLGHASLASSQPPQGTHLERAPERVSVTLTEPVDPQLSTLQVLNQENRRVDLDDQTASGGPDPEISVRLPADLPAGAYRMVWKALSRTDGHPTSGTVGFAIGGFSAPRGSSEAAIPVESALARFLAYAGFSLAFGAAAFLLWMAPAGYPGMAARVALLGGATLHAAGTLLLAANVASASGIPFDALARGEGPSLTVGQILLIRLGIAVAAWILAMVWTFRPVRAGPAVLTLFFLSSAVGSARLGHPYSAGYATMGLDFLHLVAAATWVGGLALLLFFVWQADKQGIAPEELRRLGIRFGTLAMVSVTVLALSGLVIAVAVLGAGVLTHPWSLLDSAYGIFLLGKVALAGVMVALAAVNRYVLLEEPAEKGLAAGLQKVARGATRGRLSPGLTAGRFRRTLALEAGLGAVVLVLAGLLTSVAPPAQAGPVLEVNGQGAHYLVHAEMGTPHVGNASLIHLTITPTDPGDAAVTNNTCGRADSCVAFDLLYAGSNAPEHHLAYPSGGLWMVHDAVWTQAGNVTATVVIATEDHFEDKVELRFVVT